jgi:hypothetical protein
MGANLDIVQCTEDLKIVGARDALRDGYRYLIYEGYYGPFRIRIEGYGCTGEDGQKFDAKPGGCINVTSDLGTLRSIYENTFRSVTNDIEAQCASKQAGIRLGDMARPPFTAGPAADSDPSFWLEFFDPEGRDKLNFYSLFIWSEHRSTNIAPEFLKAAATLLTEGRRPWRRPRRASRFSLISIFPTFGTCSA